MIPCFTSTNPPWHSTSVATRPFGIFEAHETFTCLVSSEVTPLTATIAYALMSSLQDGFRLSNGTSHAVIIHQLQNANKLVSRRVVHQIFFFCPRFRPKYWRDVVPIRWRSRSRYRGFRASDSSSGNGSGARATRCCSFCCGKRRLRCLSRCGRSSSCARDIRCRSLEC